jgi:hypothetical protein
MFMALCIIALLLTPPAEVPHVERDFSEMQAGGWKNRRFSEIIPADTIKRVVRESESGFARNAGRDGEQAAYDAFLAHLLDSHETANDWALGGNERTMGQLVVLTKGGDLFFIEIIGGGVPARPPHAIFVHGKGAGARIEVKNFAYPDKK